MLSKRKYLSGLKQIYNPSLLIPPAPCSVTEKKYVYIYLANATLILQPPEKSLHFLFCMAEVNCRPLFICNIHVIIRGPRGRKRENEGEETRLISTLNEIMCTEDSIINEGVKTQIKEKMDDE